MIVTKDIQEIRKFRQLHRQKTIGMVPTMGKLHEGHLSLVRQAKKKNDFCAISIYVNPTQFDRKSDFESYPRELEEDLKLLQQEHVDLVFTPDNSVMYPEPFFTVIHVKQVSERLEGASRIGHFDGIATVVCKLFLICEPDRAYFGQKDAQQVIVIRQMVRDLNINVEIIDGVTIREADGLAMSSRNVLLTPEQRKTAPVVYQSLLLAQKLFQAGERDWQMIRSQMVALIEKESSGKVDYVECNDPVTLEPTSGEMEGGELISLAVLFGDVRLIDSILV